MLVSRLLYPINRSLEFNKLSINLTKLVTQNDSSQILMSDEYSPLESMAHVHSLGELHHRVTMLILISLLWICIYRMIRIQGLKFQCLWIMLFDQIVNKVFSHQYFEIFFAHFVIIYRFSCFSLIETAIKKSEY